MSSMSVDELISRHVTTQGDSMPHVHYHERHELYYMAKGSTTYYIGDKIFHVEQGDFVFIPKGILHKTDYEDAACGERVLLSFGDRVFTGELQSLREELCNSRLICVDKEKLPYLEGLLQKIETEYQEKDAYQPVMINLYITELLIQIFRCKYEQRTALSGMDQTIYLISKYISTHCQEPLSLKELSREFAMSESHLSRKFKAYTGIGINKLREMSNERDCNYVFFVGNKRMFKREALLRFIEEAYSV